MIKNSKNSNSSSGNQNIVRYLPTENTENQKILESREQTQLYKHDEQHEIFIKIDDKALKNENFHISPESSEEEISKKQKEEEFQIKQTKLNDIAQMILENPLPNLLIEENEWDYEDLNYPMFGYNLPDENLRLKQDNFKFFNFLFKE